MRRAVRVADIRSKPAPAISSKARYGGLCAVCGAWRAGGADTNLLLGDWEGGLGPAGIASGIGCEVSVDQDPPVIAVPYPCLQVAQWCLGLGLETWVGLCSGAYAPTLLAHSSSLWERPGT